MTYGLGLNRSGCVAIPRVNQRWTVVFTDLQIIDSQVRQTTVLYVLVTTTLFALEVVLFTVH